MLIWAVYSVAGIAAGVTTIMTRDGQSSGAAGMVHGERRPIEATGSALPHETRECR